MKQFYRTLIILFLVFLHQIPQSLYAAPPLIGILINNGDKFTNKQEVSVKIKSLKTAGNLLESMQIGVSETLSDAQWEPYSENAKNIILPAGDGEKFVFVRLKDKAGNISKIEQAKIILDTTPPSEIEFFINKGAKYTNDRTGRVFIQYKGSDAVSWQIGNNSNFNDVWEKLSNNKTWTLDLRLGDGERTVYARFKDEAGNISDVQTKTIILDTKPPQNGELIINNGEKFIKSTKVKIKVKADDLFMVRLVDRNGGENYEFKPGPDGFMMVDWKFDTLQGKKIIKAYFMDEATNKSTTEITAEAIYDTRGPAPPNISINDGSKYTNEKTGKVDINIALRHSEEGLTQVLSNSENFNNINPSRYSQVVKGWQLDAAEDGLKKVYLKIFDEAGNESKPVSASIVLDRTPPTIKSFILNNGKDFITSPRVDIQITANDAVAMQISNNPNFSTAAKWEPFSETKVGWRIIPGDGEKTVYIRLKDAAGNVSETASAKVSLDSRPPLGKSMINGGKKFTNDPAGNVTLKIAYDGKDVAGMQISNTSDFSTTKLVPIETETGWQLEPGDGMKTVYIRLQDKAGNYSNIFTSNIILDRTPPDNCEIAINNHAEWMTNQSKKVALSLTATEAYKMKISNTPDFSSTEWIPYKTAIGWELEGPEGEHTVYAIFADAAGNESPVVSSTIKSDYTPPFVKLFTVDKGNKYTKDAQKRVSLTIEAEGAVSMAISNVPISETSTWEPYAPSKEWILSNEDGLKTVFARFKDQAGNVTGEYNAKIILDRVPPTESEVVINKNAEWMTNKEGKVTLFLKSLGATEMMVSNSPEFTNAKWETYSAIKDNWEINIKNTQAAVYAKFKDPAENITDVVNASIKIDITPPQNPSIEINKGAKYLIGSDKKLTIAISVHGAKFMRLSTDKNFRGTDWEPVGGFKEIIILEGDGEIEVFAQFKDQADNLSEIVSDKIILDTTPPRLNSFTIDNGEQWTNNKDKKVVLTIVAEDATEMRIDHDPAFTTSSWQKYTKTVNDFILPGEDGEKVIFLMLKDEAGNTTKIANAKINLKRTF